MNKKLKITKKITSPWTIYSPLKASSNLSMALKLHFFLSLNGKLKFFMSIKYALITNVTFSYRLIKKIPILLKKKKLPTFQLQIYEFQKLKMSRKALRRGRCYGLLRRSTWRSLGKHRAFLLLSSWGNPNRWSFQLFCKPAALASAGTNSKF